MVRLMLVLIVAVAMVLVAGCQDTGGPSGGTEAPVDTTTAAAATQDTTTTQDDAPQQEIPGVSELPTSPPPETSTVDTSP